MASYWWFKFTSSTEASGRHSCLTPTGIRYSKCEYPYRYFRILIIEILPSWNKASDMTSWCFSLMNFQNFLKLVFWAHDVLSISASVYTDNITSIVHKTISFQYVYENGYYVTKRLHHLLHRTSAITLYEKAFRRCLVRTELQHWASMNTCIKCSYHSVA